MEENMTVGEFVDKYFESSEKRQEEILEKVKGFESKGYADAAGILLSIQMRNKIKNYEI